jgi:TolB-like protein
MIYRFGSQELDTGQFELRRSGGIVALEPQVFQLLRLLIENRTRMVTKQEIAERVWKLAAVSDASISSRVRSARIAVGDDGERQQVIRTVHGQGFRFVAEVVESAPASVGQQPVDATPTPALWASKPGIAVLPFQPLGLPPDLAVLCDAIPHEVIQTLSRLRWLSVIARGSSFRFRGPDQDLAAIGMALKVRYVLSGTVEAAGRAVTLTLELADARGGEVIWADRLTASLDALAELRARVVAQLIAALEAYIPLNEAREAQLVPWDRLDAWANYHLGLQHMHRFTAVDNAAATGLFTRATEQDPGFARAHAGLSFTSFQDAFLRYGPVPESARAAARRHAERALELDPLDPFTNFTMGRSFWLTGELDAAGDWLNRATLLNPNYAQGFYARAFTDMLEARGPQAQEGLEMAIRLSPLDPLLYGMLGTRSLSLLQEGHYDAAAAWGDRAAGTPGAHFLISMIALVANVLAGREAQATHWLSDIRRRRPDASVAHFFAAFPFKKQPVRTLLTEVLSSHGARLA